MARNKGKSKGTKVVKTTTPAPSKISYLHIKNNLNSKTVVVYMQNGGMKTSTLAPYKKSTEKIKDTAEFRNSVKHLVEASVIKLEVAL